MTQIKDYNELTRLLFKKLGRVSFLIKRSLVFSFIN
jgi:hypothetical protein